MNNALLIGALAMAVAGGAMASQKASKTPAQPAQQATPAPGGRAPKSPAEAKDLQAMIQAPTPDAIIAAAEDFVTKYPDSDYKALAFFAEAQSYQQKNDIDHLVVFGDRALEANPDDGTKVQTLLLLARALAVTTREFDIDREEKLAKVEKYAGGALDLVKTMTKPNPALTDAQWDAAKADMVGQAHEALGIDQMARKEYQKAVTEYKASIEANKGAEPATEVRLAVAYEKAGNYDQSVAECDKVLALPSLHPSIKLAAQNEKARALKAKAGPPAPAAVPAPTPAPKP